jgi:hypothetical protein
MYPLRPSVVFWYNLQRSEQSHEYFRGSGHGIARPCTVIYLEIPLARESVINLQEVKREAVRRLAGNHPVGMSPTVSSARQAYGGSCAEEEVSSPLPSKGRPLASLSHCLVVLCTGCVLTGPKQKPNSCEGQDGRRRDVR